MPATSKSRGDRKGDRKGNRSLVELDGRSASPLEAMVAISRARSPQAVLAGACSLAGTLVDATAIVACWSPGDGMPGVMSTTGAAAQHTPQRALDIVGEERTATRAVLDTSAEPVLSDTTVVKTAVVGVPLDQPGAGALIAARPLDAGPFADRDEQMLSLVATQATMALAALSFDDEREQLKKEIARAEQMQNEFVAMTSHELRTPLTSIRAATSMMRSYWETLEDERKHRLLEVIESQAQRLSRLVENILAAANIEAGVVLPRITTVDLALAADEVARDFTAELDVVVECERPLLVQADPDHVRQVLINFVGNSLKYGDPPVTIAGRRAGEQAELRVSDEGPGVPPDFVPRLFDRFTQATGGLSRHATGSGLGLSIVKGLAEASGGSVRYEPATPRGACFVLTLPAT